MLLKWVHDKCISAKERHRSMRNYPYKGIRLPWKNVPTSSQLCECFCNCPEITCQEKSHRNVMEPWQYLLSTERKLNSLLRSDFNSFPLDAFWLDVPKFPAHRMSWASARLLFCQLLGKAPRQQICCLYTFWTHHHSQLFHMEYGITETSHTGSTGASPPSDLLLSWSTRIALFRDAIINVRLQAKAIHLYSLLAMWELH